LTTTRCSGKEGLLLGLASLVSFAAMAVDLLKSSATGWGDGNKSSAAEMCDADASGAALDAAPGTAVAVNLASCMVERHLGSGSALDSS